ncbi:hypothetical protein [Tetragenococcus halophilus]|uniref:hypothetical protein n=1 Tax=Tetragenococcus halophilus TaxID=51669 RepID=UPI002A9D88D2|nr:hypothetical protein TEHSL10_11700 [Tetragenococcus halophilus]
MSNYNKTKKDLEKEFQDNLSSLQLNCEHYDRGNDFSAIDIATRLRVLLHDKGKNNVSLFNHMGLKEIKFLDTADKICEENILGDECLVYVSPDENFEFMKYYPNLDESPEHRFIDFEPWWSQTVYRDDEKRFSRSDIVLNITNKDGGTHSDSKIPKDYYEFSRKGSGATTTYTINGIPVGETKDMGNLHFASLRQIAYEVIETLRNV